MADVKNSGISDALVSTVVDTGRSFIGGFIDDYFNKQSERRADSRNRKLIRDTPRLQMEGLRKAGLNPYHLSDVSLPGLSSQSDTDTSLIGTPFLEQLLSIERVNNEGIVAESTANRNNAEAERLRGQEGRDVEGWQYKLDTLIEGVTDIKLKNRMSEINLEIAEYTKDNRKFQSDLDVQEGLYAIEQQIANIALTNTTIEEKEQNIANLIEEQKYLQLQQALARVGINKTIADTKEVYANIKLMASQKNLTDQQAGYYKELAFLTDAEKENQLIQNAVDDKYAGKRAKMNLVTGYVDSITGGLKRVSDSALEWVAALATGGVSAGVSSIVKASTTDAPAGVFDSYGNPIR